MDRLIIILLFISPFILQGQITIGNNTLPGLDDTLFYHTDYITDINVGMEGEGKFWDFSNLSSGIAEKVVLQKQDPQLDAKGIDYDFFIKEKGEIFRLYKKEGNAIYEVAVQRPHPLNSDYICFSKYEKKKLYRFSNIDYQDEKTSRSIIYFNLPGNQIPNLIEKKLPIKAEALRVRVEEIHDFTFDAWGTLRLNFDAYNVLRLYHNIFRSISVEIYSTGKWSPINNSILDPNGSFLKSTTEIFYEFYSDKDLEPIAKAKVDYTGNVEYVEFKASQFSKNIVTSQENKPVYIMSPNPTFGDVKLEMLNADFGEYNLELFNVIGKRIWSDKINVDKTFSSFKLDFTFLGKGTYVWALTNNRGVRITTKRLVIMTP